MATAAASKTVKKSANPFMYHVGSPSPFWEKFRKALVLNPDSPTGNPLVPANRTPTPSSRPERFAQPGTLASDIADNPYWRRDFRRMYPKYDPVDQEQVVQLLMQGEGELGRLPKPSNLPLPQAIAAESSSDPTASAVPAPIPESLPSLSALYSAPVTEKKVAEAGTTTEGEKKSGAGVGLPPVPPGKKYIFKKAPEGSVPRDQWAYFPMDNFV